MNIDQFIKEHREEYNTEDAVYSSYHYDAMEAYAKLEVIKELERMSDILLLENEHKPIDKRIEELKRKD